MYIPNKPAKYSIKIVMANDVKSKCMLRNLPYKDRVKRLNLHSLERRRARGDITIVFKWVKGINKDNIDQVLEFSS